MLAVRLIVALGLLLGLATWPVAGQESSPDAEPVGESVAAPGVPSEAEPLPAPAAQTSPEPGARWVATHRATELWSDSDAGVSFGAIRPQTYLQLTDQGADSRLYVFNPRTENYAWVDAEAVGPATAPPDSYLRGPALLEVVQKPGRVVGGFNLRNWPAVRDDTLLRPLGHNAPLWVQEAVVGDDGETWYRLGDDEYVHASGVRLPRPPPRTFPGRWIDVDLSEPAMMTAYEGDQVVYSALAIKGMVASTTPVGVYRILRRVANETMDSSTLGIPRNSPRGWYLRNVLYTQYFTNDGAAIHYNYWSSVFGYAGSRGCLGLNLEDSLWYWNWAGVGTPLNVHY
jgi:hypothetical protein